MPSFNGVDLGPFVNMKTRPNPAGLQLTPYPGVNGLAALAMGSRGFVTTAEVLMVGATMTALGAAANTWYSAVAAQVGGTLIDSYGISWSSAVIVGFYPLDEPGPTCATDGSGTPVVGMGQTFAFEFLHLI